MSYHIEYIPQVHDRTKHLKGNGRKRGCIEGHPFKPNDRGMSYPDGIGCSRHDNCFTCTLPVCEFEGAFNKEDQIFMSNRGDGIKVW